MTTNFVWQGRDDGVGAQHLRMFHLINKTKTANFRLIGFASDAGVLRNQGRIGAVDGPNAIRKQLVNLAVHNGVEIEDVGDIRCTEDELEHAQAELADLICDSLKLNCCPIVLGGGHEVAFGSYSGLLQYHLDLNSERQIGIVNFDAHFDLRQARRASSGTPFYQAAQLAELHHKKFNYLCLGIAQHANTKILFDTAHQLQCQYVFDHEIQQCNLATVMKKVEQFVTEIDDLYVTIDLDVFSCAIAPGVSAPAVKGIDLASFESLFQCLVQSGKIRLLDIAECNPKFDIDQRTAKLAAYIIYNFVFSKMSTITR